MFWKFFITHNFTIILDEINGIRYSQNELDNGNLTAIQLVQTDMEVESGMIRALIVGIDINVHQTVSDLAGTDSLTSLDMETGRPNSRPAIAASLILSLDKLRHD